MLRAPNLISYWSLSVSEGSQHRLDSPPWAAGLFENNREVWSILDHLRALSSILGDRLWSASGRDPSPSFGHVLVSELKYETLSPRDPSSPRDMIHRLSQCPKLIPVSPELEGRLKITVQSWEDLKLVAVEGPIYQAIVVSKAKSGQAIVKLENVHGSIKQPLSSTPSPCIDPKIKCDLSNRLMVRSYGKHKIKHDWASMTTKVWGCVRDQAVRDRNYHQGWQFRNVRIAWIWYSASWDERITGGKLTCSDKFDPDRLLRCCDIRARESSG